MSEVIIANRIKSGLRRQLLTTAAIIALVAAVGSANHANAESFLASDNPPVWIELGGQFDALTHNETEWVPNLDTAASGKGVFIRGAPLYGYDLDASALYQPEDSDWVLSAAVHYGRSVRHKQFHTQVASVAPLSSRTGVGIYQVDDYDTRMQSVASHTIIDFKVGKDVGLGFAGSSLVSVGIRVAQFNAKSLDFVTDFPARGYFPPLFHRMFHDNAETHRNLWAMGPSISWDASARLSGSVAGGFTFDWGANGAILFGKQRTSAHIVTAYQRTTQNSNYSPPINSAVNTTHVRSRQVIVPNLGGFAGFSVRWPAAKISVGYRGDFYFGALDGGFATRASVDRAFYGPFANISIGLGG